MDPVAWASRYRNSATSLSVILPASAEVEGFGGREARKSPYAGASWSLTSARVRPVLAQGVFLGRSSKLTIDALALGQVVVVLVAEEAVPIPSNNPLDVAVSVSSGTSPIRSTAKIRANIPAVNVEEQALHDCNKIECPEILRTAGVRIRLVHVSGIALHKPPPQH